MTLGRVFPARGVPRKEGGIYVDQVFVIRPFPSFRLRTRIHPSPVWKWGSPSAVVTSKSQGTIERKTVSKGCWEQEPHTETEDSHSVRGWGKHKC